jgi:hypothetical protein
MRGLLPSPSSTSSTGVSASCQAQWVNVSDARRPGSYAYAEFTFPGYAFWPREAVTGTARVGDDAGVQGGELGAGSDAPLRRA